VPGNETDTLNIVSPASAIAGDYSITVTGTDSGGNTSSTTIDLFVTAGFTLSANPGSLTLQPGGSATATVAAIDAGSESGNVVLAATATDMFGNATSAITVSAPRPASATIGGSPSAITISAPSGATPGNYLVNLVGTDASGNSSTATIQATVQTGGFTVTPASASITAAGGSPTQSDVITVSSIGSFTGGVTVTVTSITDASGNPAGGVIATFLPFNTSSSTGIVLPFNDTNTLSITALAGAPVGYYTVNLTGTDGSGNTATAQIAVNITAGFTLTATPANVTIPPGGSVSAAIAALAAGTESGSVTLADRPTIAGLTLALSPSSVGIGNGSTSTATLSLGSSVLPGTTFTATVTGTDSSGDKSSVNINVTVDAFVLRQCEPHSRQRERRRYQWNDLRRIGPAHQQLR